MRRGARHRGAPWLPAAGAGAVLALASQAMGQGGVELRIVERSGRTEVAPGNTVLNFAVQARVNGGAALGDFSFEVRIEGEPESAGVLSRERINNLDGTYSGLPGVVNGSVGQGGLARTYTYIAFINPNFNGLINTSGGTFTHTPGNQEIGLIVGSATAFTLLQTPGVDVWDGDVSNIAGAGGDNSPDGWNAAHSWDSQAGGAAPMPVSGDTADLDAATARTYFAKGEFIDVYRFRYVPTEMTARTLRVRLANVSAYTFAHLGFGYGWSTLEGSQITSVSVQGMDVQVAAVVATGRCCTGAGCVVTTASGCAGEWADGAPCGAHACPGACCVGTMCSRVDDLTCIVAMHGRFQGAASACGTSANPTTCCPANVDGIDGVTVADVFVFVNTWLGGGAGGDFNGDGVRDQFDVFAFVQAWFGGC